LRNEWQTDCPRSSGGNSICPLHVECQSQLEKQNKISRSRVPVTSLFGLTDGEEGAEGEEEEPATENKE
jgi:hypothetical protein